MNKSDYEIPVDGKVMACLDVSVYNNSVTDYAAWASRRLAAAMVCLHVLDRNSVRPAEPDYSGSIGIDAGSHLLDELAELDAQHNRIAMQQGRAMLEQACARAAAAGALQPQPLQRHGPLAQALTELEDQVRLFVLGKRGEAANFNTGHLGANLERVVRSVHRPTLVTSRAFRPVNTFGIAFDGSPTTRKCVEMVAMSPLLKGLTCHLIVAGKSTESPEGLDWATGRLEQAGFAPQAHVEAGEAEQVIAAQVERLDIDLLVMGAYGHSRIRHLIVGSTTTTILRNCHIPVLLLR
ncbi:MAG: universal stress protein [Wenzhouxiangellaceae bacterium]|nr:universal stress protein [Wenzhouxiangellaceae bacterium]